MGKINNICISRISISLVGMSFSFDLVKEGGETDISSVLCSFEPVKELISDVLSM